MKSISDVNVKAYSTPANMMDTLLENVTGFTPVKGSKADPEKVPKLDSTYSISLLVIFYIITIFTALCYSGRYDHDPITSLPWIGKNNGTNVIMNNLATMENEYTQLQLNENWKVLCSDTNVKIETLDDKELYQKDKNYYYIRITALYANWKPSELYKYFTAEKFHETMSTVDPFYESSSLLFSPSTNFFGSSEKINVLKKVTCFLLFLQTRVIIIVQTLLKLLLLYFYLL